MPKSPSSLPAERLFPFALRSRILLVGREVLRRSKRKLQFVLITSDLSENSRGEILADFAHYPVVQRFTSAELDTFFRIRGAKVVGFAKSSLARSIYAALKESRINLPQPARPPEPPVPGGQPPSDSAALPQGGPASLL